MEQSHLISTLRNARCNDEDSYGAEFLTLNKDIAKWLATLEKMF